MAGGAAARAKAAKLLGRQAMSQLWSRYGLLSSGVVVGTIALLFGLAPAFLATAGMLLLLSVLLLYRSVSDPDKRVTLSFEEALELATISATERKKEVVLRALRDIDVERALGKLSNSDYLELAGRYREEALRIMEELEDHEGSLRTRIEEILRLRSIGQSCGDERDGSVPARDQGQPPESTANEGRSW